MDLRKPDDAVRQFHGLFQPGSLLRPIHQAEPLLTMAYSHIYVLPENAAYGSPEVYDRWGNLAHFADVTGLEDKVTDGGTDAVVAVKAHSRKPYLNSKVEISVPAQSRNVMTGVRQTKGAIPGKTVTLVSPTEKRQFQVVGNLSGFYGWLMANNLVEVQMYGPSGTPYDPIAEPVAG